MRPSSVEESDDDLLTRVAAGDPGAYRRLVERHLGRVVRVAERILGSPSEAEDVAQAVFLKVWRRASAWRGKDRGGTAQFTTWLHRVTVNAALDGRRRRRTTPLADIPEPVDERPNADQVLQTSAVQTRVRAAMATLPERQRAALVLSHFEGLANPETAAILDVSVEAVESLLARGRRALKMALAGEIAGLLEGDEA